MVEALCIEKIRDKNGVIISYLLQDGEGSTKRFLPDELKSAIITGNIRVNNLKLTSDNRLIDIKPEEFKRYDNEVMTLVDKKSEYALLRTIQQACNLKQEIIDFSQSESGKALAIQIRDGKLVTNNGETLGTGNEKLKEQEITELIFTVKVEVKKVNKVKSALLIDYTTRTYLKNSKKELIDNELNRSFDLWLNRLLDSQEIRTYYTNLENSSKGVYDAEQHLKEARKTDIYRHSLYENNMFTHINTMSQYIIILISMMFNLNSDETSQLTNIDTKVIAKVVLSLSMIKRDARVLKWFESDELIRDYIENKNLTEEDKKLILDNMVNSKEERAKFAKTVGKLDKKSIFGMFKR